ncbi:acetate kinase [Sulfurimonas sp. SWIR-19]|uniref:acetate/propionate family kinase n=1 Tax=Sulfurimonas sp. SWIR-19 TaxID=2878390 RepID=UPI001CF5E840|nr:acetate kinase [Sulfurimonas sp. SWIR-19]UCN00973.1 acetate kinase [Sulfurimonas sp. SWIR-19]
MKIAVINCGSSSLKFKLFEMPDAKVLRSELVEHIGEENSPIQNHFEAIESLHVNFSEIDAVGHRVVHGGEKFRASVLIDDAVVQTIRKLIPLAPLHNPANLEGIEVVLQKAPNIPQIAVFDTAFHATLKKEAFVYALPYALYEKHDIRRYGFHGTSHAYLLREAAARLGKKVQETNIITLHLGNGASACAIKKGKSCDTSMGFTPLEGLVMGSRCGDLDPAIVLYLQKSLHVSAEEIDEILNKKSGLLGLCGENDVRNIEKRTDEAAKMAMDIMVRRIQKYIGAYMVLLEDVDAIVFSGGIGENSSYVRERVMNNKILKNIKSLVIKTDEELQIVNECLEVLKK